MEKLRNQWLIIILSLLSASVANAQKVKFDEKANAILAENMAAAMLVEKTRTAEIDTARKRKQKVATALGQIQLFKEMYKNSQRNTLFFNTESTYYKLILKDANGIISILPAFIATATKRPGIGQLMAIKTGQEIIEEIDAVLKVYHNVVLGKKHTSISKYDMVPVDDDGGDLGGGSQGGNGGVSLPITGGSDGEGGGDNHVIKPDPDLIGDRPIGEILPRSTRKRYANSDAEIIPMDTIVRDEDPIVIGNENHESGGMKGDGFNWLDRQERLKVAIDLHTRLSRIHFKMKQFILCSQYYDWKCVLRTYDPHTWRVIYASSYVTKDIINRMKKFNFDLNK